MSKKDETVMEYFFEGGDVEKPRRGTVSRQELFAVLDWYHRRVLAKQSVWSRIKQWFSNTPRVSPFAWVAYRQGRD